MSFEAKVYTFPGANAALSKIRQIREAGRREDAANLRRRCRIQADVARSCAEQAAHLAADADTDGHTEAVKRLQLATLRFKQAQRELRLAEREIQP